MLYKIIWHEFNFYTKNFFCFLVFYFLFCFFAFMSLYIIRSTQIEPLRGQLFHSQSRDCL